MSRIRSVFAVGGVAALAFGAGMLARNNTSVAAPAQDTGQQEAQLPPEVQAYMKATEPGDHHKYLNQLTGTWDGTVRIWMEPGAEPMEFPGTARREWTLDGRFIKEEVEAQSPFGGTFRGIGFTGYNNLDKQYETVWLENMSTGIYTERGTYNPETKMFYTWGSHRDPLTGAVAPMHGEGNLSNPDRHTWTGWTWTEDGQKYKSFEGVFTRRN